MELLIAPARDVFGCAYDDHGVPAEKIVPSGATVVVLEDGLDPVFAWLSATLRRPVFAPTVPSHAGTCAPVRAPGFTKHLVERIVVVPSAVLYEGAGEARVRIDGLDAEDGERCRTRVAR